MSMMKRTTIGERKRRMTTGTTKRTRGEAFRLSQTDEGLRHRLCESVGFVEAVAETLDVLSNEALILQYPDVALGLTRIVADMKRHRDALELMAAGVGRVEED